MKHAALTLALTLVLPALYLSAPVPVEADCFSWSGQVTLQEAVDTQSCISIVPGVYPVSETHVWDSETIVGNSATLVARTDPDSPWTETPDRANHALFIVHTGAQLTASNLTLDGANVASYLVTPGGYTLDNMVFINSACSALGVMRSGAVVRNSVFDHNAWNCEPFSELPIGAAIYGQHSNSQEYWFSPVITGNTFTDTFGPALDINGVWGGTFSDNRVATSVGWAGVSLYGSSYWTINNNRVSHPWSDEVQDYHPWCVPPHAKSAAIFMCQDTTGAPWLTNFNTVTNNRASGFYGILLVGYDELLPWVTPRLITLTGNTVTGSAVGCADDFKLGQWYAEKNTWLNNNCQGVPNSAPWRF